MADIEDVVNDVVAHMGAAAAAMGAASGVPAISSGITTVAGALAGTKGGATIGTIALGLGAAPIAVIGGGLLLIGVGVAKVCRK